MNPAAQPSIFETIIFPMGIFFMGMYFFIFRPQMRKAKEQQTFLNSLKRGDEVVTHSGILGRIEGLTDSVITLEISDGVRIKILKTQVAGSTKATLETKK